MNEPRASLMLRIAPSLHRQLKESARRSGVSLNHYCRTLLSPAQLLAPPGEKLGLAMAAGKNEGLPDLGTIRESLLDEFKDDLEGIVLFGSWARGQANTASDIDLLVIFAEGAGIDRDIYARWQPQKLSGHEVSPLFVQLPRSTEEPRGIWLEAALEGILLFDRSLKVSRYLAHVRSLMAAGRVRRMMTHGHPYWIHERSRTKEE